MQQITNHSEQAIARLVQQFRDKPRFQKFIGAIGARSQSTEDALWDLATKRSLETATGAQLDNLGQIVGEAREGKDDATYRIFIRARILINLGSGTCEDLIALFKLILSAYGNNQFALEEDFPAGLALKVFGALTVEPDSLARIFERARDAAVRGNIFFSLFPANQTFQFANSWQIPESGNGFSSIAQDIGGHLSSVKEA